MFWKIYFVVYTLLTIIGLFGVFAISPNLADWSSIVFSLILIVPAYSLGFSKKIFSAQTWKLLLWTNVIFWGVNALYELTPLRDSQTLSFLKGSATATHGSTEVLFYFILILPAIYGLYKLSKSSR